MFDAFSILLAYLLAMSLIPLAIYMLYVYSVYDGFRCRSEVSIEAVSAWQAEALVAGLSGRDEARLGGV